MIAKDTFKRLRKVIGYILLTLCAVITALDAYVMIDQRTPENWEAYPIESIVITDDAWQKHEITTLTSEILPYSVVAPKVAVPLRYVLAREKYNIDIEVNSGKEVSGIALQILATDKTSGDVLTVKSQWNGNCGILGDVSKNGKLELPRDATHILHLIYFTDPRVVGFVWQGNSALCKDGQPKTLEYNSQFPIILDIYQGDRLIGHEEIPIKMFQNGIVRRKPMAIYLWGIIFSKISKFWS